MKLGPSILLAAAAGVALTLSGAAPGRAAQQQQQQSQKTTDSSVYNTEQADRGQKVYDAVCAACHVTSEYNNDAFRGLWQGRTLFDLFDIISFTMPQDDPGGLPRKDYVDVVAYLLRLNGAPAGQAEIATDSASLKAIRINWKKS